MNKQVQSIPAEIARSEPAPTLAERLRIARGRQSQAAFAASLGVPVLARLPIDSKTARLVDQGAVELADDKSIAPVADFLEQTFRNA